MSTPTRAAKKPPARRIRTPKPAIEVQIPAAQPGVKDLVDAAYSPPKYVPGCRVLVMAGLYGARATASASMVLGVGRVMEARLTMNGWLYLVLVNNEGEQDEQLHFGDDLTDV